MWCGKIIKSFTPHLIFLLSTPFFHVCHLFSPFCCFISSTGGALRVTFISLLWCTFYSPLKGPPGAWLLVRSVSRLPRLPSRFLAPSPPWGRALYVLPTESGRQVSCGTTQMHWSSFRNNTTVLSFPVSAQYPSDMLVGSGAVQEDSSQGQSCQRRKVVSYCNQIPQQEVLLWPWQPRHNRTTEWCTCLVLLANIPFWYTLLSTSWESIRKTGPETWYPWHDKPKMGCSMIQLRLNIQIW